MAKKNTADVLINGKVYTISGYESTAYLQKVATYLNEMEEKVAVTEGYARLTADEKQLLKNMNLADVYFKADAARESLEKEKEQKDRELYSLKHDLIDAKLEQEKRSLTLTGDFFKRIILTKDAPAPHYTEDGILIMGIYDFLLNENSLES